MNDTILATVFFANGLAVGTAFTFWLFRKATGAIEDNVSLRCERDSWEIANSRLRAELGKMLKQEEKTQSLIYDYRAAVARLREIEGE